MRMPKRKKAKTSIKVRVCTDMQPFENRLVGVGANGRPFLTIKEDPGMKTLNVDLKVLDGTIAQLTSVGTVLKSGAQPDQAAAASMLETLTSAATSIFGMLPEDSAPVPAAPEGVIKSLEEISDELGTIGVSAQGHDLSLTDHVDTVKEALGKVIDALKAAATAAVEEPTEPAVEPEPAADPADPAVAAAPASDPEPAADPEPVVDPEADPVPVAAQASEPAVEPEPAAATPAVEPEPAAVAPASDEVASIKADVSSLKSDITTIKTLLEGLQKKAPERSPVLPPAAVQQGTVVKAAQADKDDDLSGVFHDLSTPDVLDKFNDEGELA